MTAAHDTQALADIAAAKKILARLCDEGLVHMSLPVQSDDEDMVLSRVIGLASRLQEQEGQPALGFVIDQPGTACRCIRWPDGGARPASTAEEAMWDALAAGSQAVQVPADKSQAARYEIGKWLNEGQLREVNQQALAELCAGFDQLERAVQVPEATQDELLELAEALERRRCITISETVKTEQTRFEKDGKPTAFSAGFTLACEEIAHRIEHEEWVFQDPGTPQQPLAGGEVQG